MLGVFLAVAWKPLAAMWYANLGSVAQTRVELAAYSFPDRLVEYVRRSEIANCVPQRTRDLRFAPKLGPATDAGSPLRSEIADCRLGEAEGYFRQALSLDGGNVTANQRLAELALSFDSAAGGWAEPQGQVPGQDGYEAARGYAEAAYARDPGNAVTWQLLGDAYLALGRMDEAYGIWSRVSDAKSKLEIESDIRYARNGDRERAGWAMSLAERMP